MKTINSPKNVPTLLVMVHANFNYKEEKIINNKNLKIQPQIFQKNNNNNNQILLRNMIYKIN